MKKFIIALCCLFMLVGCSKPKEEPIPTTDPVVYGKESKSHIFITCLDEPDYVISIAYDIYTNLDYETLGVNCFREEDTDIFDGTFSYEHNANENACNLIDHCFTRMYEDNPTKRSYFVLLLDYYIKYISDDEITRLKNEFLIKIEDVANNMSEGIYFSFRVNDEQIIDEYY